MKDFVIRAVGENDKVVLPAGMAFVITAAAVLAGLLSRRPQAAGPSPGPCVRQADEAMPDPTTTAR